MRFILARMPYMYMPLWVVISLIWVIAGCSFVIGMIVASYMPKHYRCVLCDSPDCLHEQYGVLLCKNCKE